MELLLQHGFPYASSMMAQDYLPYQGRQGDERHHDRAGEARPADKAGRDADQLVARRLSGFEYIRARTSSRRGSARPSGVVGDWLADHRYMASALDWGVLTYTFHPESPGAATGYGCSSG